jgi:hypothetical protein
MASSMVPNDTASNQHDARAFGAELQQREEETSGQELSPVHGAMALDAWCQQHGAISFGAVLFALGEDQ